MYVLRYHAFLRYIYLYKRITERISFHHVSNMSHIENNIVFLDMLRRGELLRSELLRKVRPEELKAILELCLNMKEGNLTMPKRNPSQYHNIITILANRNISLSNKKKRMLEYNKVLYNIISPALKEWKRKFRRI